MRNDMLTALAVLGLLCAAEATAQEKPRQDPEVWVTLGADALTPVRESLARKGGALPAPVCTKDGVAVVRVRESLLPELSTVMHEELRRCGGFVAHDSREEALASLTATPATARALPDVRYTLDNSEGVAALLGGLEELQLRETLTTLAAFPTRAYTSPHGVAAATWLKDQWTRWAQGRSDVSVSFFSHAGWPQPSVVLTMQGTTLPDEVVVIGGHLDSINSRGGTSAPGADDNASGIASLSEVLRVALARGYRPQRTVKFMAYAAEEAGLRGSKEIAKQHRAEGAKVVGVLQLDMTNHRGSAMDIGIVNDGTSLAQNAFLTRLIDTYLPGVTWRTTSCGYGCSDHYSWTAEGYPASAPFEALASDANPFIHTEHDTLSRSLDGVRHALVFSRLTAAYLAELAKGTVGAPLH